ncbi:thimet oligopeptidase [Coniochaeta sp. PMI_546]|nr:thimet oligopeptidase [Coniochaeta sp. PMI_546]
MSDSRRSSSQPPIKFAADAESIARAGSELCVDLHNSVNYLVSMVTPADATFDKVLRVLLEHENEMQLKANVIKMYSLVSPNASLRSAAAEWSEKIMHAEIDRKANTELFRLVDAKYDSSLDAENRKALVEEQQDYLRKGMGLRLVNAHGPRRTLLNKARRIEIIGSQFLKNLDGQEHSLWLTREELAGVPDNELSGLEVGIGNVAGKLRLNLNGPEARSFLTMAHSSVTRDRLYLEARQVENTHLFCEAVNLRSESARLMGYPSHLAYKVEVTMAKTPVAVMIFLNGIRDRLPCDVGKLLELKKADSTAQSGPHGDALLWSDIPYYSRVYEELNYSLDQNLIAEHFPLYQTISKMLGLFGRLFDFVFEKLENKDSEPSILEQSLVWHSDVVLYSVWNDEREGGKFAGYLYLDLHPRPGKCGGAQCRPLQLGFERPDGQRHYPSTVLLTNFSKPALDRPSLLQHSDVVLLFHELGHGIHDVSGRCKYSRFHGAETVMDFNEAPSQMLENWCWDATALKELSGHYRTGATLPDTIITLLLRTRVVLPAVKLLPQLRMTLFDADVHSKVPLGDGSIDVAGIYADYADLGGIKNVGDKNGYATYRHLFSGSDAGLYSYLWSKVLAMDMFDTVFKQNPLDEKVGRRYRHFVLEKGGSQDEMDTVVQLLGRKPTSEAFYRSLGLE